jgi:hypothetical protein
MTPEKETPSPYNITFEVVADEGVLSLRSNFDKMVEVINTKEELIRKSLISLGWKPPEADQVPVQDVREAVNTAKEMLVCAYSWVPEACLMGNVRAGDIRKSLETLIRAARQQPDILTKDQFDDLVEIYTTEEIIAKHPNGVKVEG